MAFAQAASGEEQLQPVHWAFASLVGTGWYDVKDGQSAFIMGITPRQSIREPLLLHSGERRIGVNIRYDAALGLYNIEEIIGIAEPENFSTVSFTPGVEFEIPVTAKWRLRAYVDLGWGTAFDDGQSAWIYYTGVKSRYQFGKSTDRFALLNGIYYAGFLPDSGPSADLAALFTGLEYRHGFPVVRWRTEALDLVWHVGYTYLSDPAAFGLYDASLESIGDTWEVGLAVALRERQFRIGWFEFERLGLTYTTDDAGEFGAITLNLNSWFTR